MKKIIFFISLLLLNTAAKAQLTQPRYPDSLFSTYYHQKVTLFRSLPDTKKDIIFLGNSITDGGEWSELFQSVKVKNRGISGDVTFGIINRIDEITTGKPAKVFLMIGVNDLARGISADSVLANILWIASYLRQETPSTQLYIESILPVNDIYGKFGGHTSKGEAIKQVNEGLKTNAAAYHYSYIDLFTPFADDQGKLKAELSNDGLHLKSGGYLLWKSIISPYVLKKGKKSP